MATIEERFEMIRQSVMAQAGEEAEELRRQARQLQESAMKQTEDDVLQELYSKVQDEVAEIRAGTTRSVAQKETEGRRELLLRRDEITRAVFQEVRRRLADYTGTPEYTRLLEDTAKELAEKCPGTGSVVMLRHDDLHLADKLGGLFGGDARVVEDESIRLGGIKVMNQSSGLFLDETLDGRLEDQKAWFYRSSGLTL